MNELTTDLWEKNTEQSQDWSGTGAENEQMDGANI